MEFRSSYRYARISPRKARYVIDLVRGKSVNDALRILRITHKRSSYMIDKVIRAAIAAANESLDVDIDSLYVAQALSMPDRQEKGNDHDLVVCQREY